MESGSATYLPENKKYQLLKKEEKDSSTGVEERVKGE
jgi:hypothetical protein